MDGKLRKSLEEAGGLAPTCHLIPLPHRLGGRGGELLLLRINPAKVASDKAPALVIRTLERRRNWFQRFRHKGGLLDGLAIGGR